MFASLRATLVVCLAVTAAALASPSVAHADGLPGGATVTFSELRIRRDGKTDFVVPKDEEETWRYFNRAHCICSHGGGGNAFVEDKFGYRLQLVGRTQPINRPGEIWTGTSCNTETGRTGTSATCSKIEEATINDLDDLADTDTTVAVPVSRLIDPMQTKTGADCVVTDGTAALWLLADGNGDQTYDYFPNKDIKIDTRPPPTPTALRATPGEGAINISWKAPTERSEDVYRYQFLCARKEGAALVAARATPSHDAYYQTALSLCNVNSSIEFTGTAPEWAKPADPAFVCGEATGTATDARLGGLTNGAEHEVVVLAIDKYGNASGIAYEGTVVPQAVTDFWEDLQDAGDPEGGFCLIAQAYGDDSDLTNGLREFRDRTLVSSAAGRWLTARYYELSAAVAPHLTSSLARALVALALAPAVALALLWHLVTLPGLLALGLALVAWRRLARAQRGGRWRKVKGLAPAGALAFAFVCASEPAEAQSVRPYWEDDLAATQDSEPAGTAWHVGLRAGPYTPAIDAQLGGAAPGPYEAMFGGYAILPALDVERVLWQGLGQLTVGGSVGYMGKNARAYIDSTDNNSLPREDRMRSSDRAKFRLIPTSLTAGFRFTALDDRYGIPLVPYVRGGLAYYLWWVEAPDGGVARACTGGDACNEEKGRGGSLGLVGSIGLAIRAERIDDESAAAMREGGVQHAGFYAELQGGWVNDFGIGDKLSVGDLTWFAGVDFEF